MQVPQGGFGPQKLGTFDSFGAAHEALERVMRAKHQQTLVELERLAEVSSPDDFDGPSGKGLGINVPGYTYSINVLP